MNNDSSQVFPEKISIKAFLILRGGDKIHRYIVGKDYEERNRCQGI